MFLSNFCGSEANSTDRSSPLQLRLQALAEYEILDTPEELGFDELATLAADIFEAPIASITLIDSYRQWFKAKVGIEPRETPLESSMCVHGLYGPDLLVVPNANEDPRFSNNPAVCADDGVRFYAGARLANPAGVPLGMICIADTTPRAGISVTQARMLRTLAAQVVTLLELRRECQQRAVWTEEAKRAREDAEAAVAAKSLFLANMSHEIRTPLNSIVGFTDLLLEDPDLVDKQRRQIELIHNSGTVLSSVINDILDLSKGEAGKIELNVEPFSILAMVDNTMSIVRNAAEAKGLNLATPISPHISGFHAGDSQRLRQVLLNLVSNAIKFTSEGGIQVRVEFGGQGEDLDMVLFAVSDTGPGVPHALQGRLFKDFSQADSSISRQFGGSGLGLAISKRLVELMGGSIGYASNEGQGSTFWFKVPLPRSDSPSKASNLQVRQCHVRRARILLVDDVYANRELGSAILTKHGHHVDIAENGLLAVAAVQAQTYDLILMDIQMPVMDGISATKAIRELTSRASTVPIIALTANVLPDQISSLRAVGMNGHVAKPIDQRALLEVIGQMLDSTKEPVDEIKAKSEVNTFDHSVYSNILELLGPPKLRSLLSSLDRQFEEASNIKADDPDLRSFAHRLISIAGMLGFTEVSRLCNILQNAPDGSGGLEDAYSAVLREMMPARAKVVALIDSL